MEENLSSTERTGEKRSFLAINLVVPRCYVVGAAAKGGKAFWGAVCGGK